MTPCNQRPAGCAVVIFGASGDLTRRKLVPALYNLTLDGNLTDHVCILGVARRPKDDPSFVEEMRSGVEEFSRQKPLQPEVWSRLAPRLGYVQGSFESPQTYRDLAARLEEADAKHGTAQNRLYYMAVGPSDVPTVLRGLHEAKLLSPDSKNPGVFHRVIVEKPFGRDLVSARELNQLLFRYCDERQLYRMDHYLGKETVQNILALRFANSIFEPLWNRHHISHVEITVAEDLGIEGRGKFYETVGITRDILQNHVLQVLTLLAMEPPSALHADAIRDEKVKVLRALRPLQTNSLANHLVRGQYTKATVQGHSLVGYREEPYVDPNSRIETYVAMRLFIDTRRWAGVPFFLRVGKRLAVKKAEATVYFRPPSLPLFATSSPHAGPPNQVTLRLQPNEGVVLQLASKTPGMETQLQPAGLGFDYETAFGTSGPEAYERLLLDAMRGDATLFTRHDEVEAQWTFMDPVLQAWQDNQVPLVNYASGSTGPVEADRLMQQEGFSWQPLSG